jgi:hypothetical protein
MMATGVTVHASTASSLRIHNLLRLHSEAATREFLNRSTASTTNWASKVPLQQDFNAGVNG